MALPGARAALRDSAAGRGGRGAHRGGDGVVREIEFLEPMQAAILSNRRRVPPFGLAGGEPGACGSNYVIRADGAVERACGDRVRRIRGRRPVRDRDAGRRRLRRRPRLTEVAFRRRGTSTTSVVMLRSW